MREGRENEREVFTHDFVVNVYQMNVKLHFLQHIVQHVSTEVQQARLQAIPTSTKKDTAWCFNIWRDWSVANSTDADNIPQDITRLCPEKLTRYISRFILEVRKKDGTEYPPNTLYHIICRLMRHLRQNGRCRLL